MFQQVMLELSLNNSSLLEVELETKMDDLNFEYMLREGRGSRVHE